jgi:hypothetical protein
MVTLTRRALRDLRYWRAHLDAIDDQGDGSIMARCPAHDDGRPSLHVTERKGRDALVRCFAGCAYADVVAAVDGDRRTGHADGEASPPTASPRRTRQAPLDWYADYCGVGRAFVGTLPIEEREGKVAFTFSGTTVVRTRDPQTGDHGWAPKGAKTPPIWPLLDEYPASIVLTEGESDCVVLRSRGIDAFAITKGAATALTRSQIDALRRRGVGRIVVAFDADAEGSDGSSELSARIVAAGLDVGTVRPPDYDPLTGAGKDWRAWHLAGGRDLPSPDEAHVFLTRSELAAIMPTNLDWIWHPLLYRSGITLLSGPEKAGKSSFLSDLLGHLTRGDMFLGRAMRKASVLILTEEWGPPITLKLDRYDVRARTLAYAEAAAASLTFTDALVLAAREVKAGRAEIVVIDTFAQWAGIENENDASEVTASIALIRSTVARAGAAVIVVHHFRKDDARARGSTALTSSVDILAEFAPDPNGDPDDRAVNVKGRVVEPTYFLLSYDRDTQRYSDRGSGDGVIAIRVSRAQALRGDQRKRREAITALLTDAALSVEELRSALAREGITASPNTLRADLHDLQAIESDAQGRSHKRVFRLDGGAA